MHVFSLWLATLDHLEFMWLIVAIAGLIFGGTVAGLFGITLVWEFRMRRADKRIARQ